MCFARNETLQKYVRTNKVRKADKPWQHGLNSSSFWNISHAGETLQGNLVTPEVSHLHTRNTRRRRREQSANRAALLCSHATQHTSKKKSDTTHAESEKTPTSHYSSQTALMAIKHFLWLSLWVKGTLNWPCAGIISVLPDLTHPCLSHECQMSSWFL